MYACMCTYIHISHARTQTRTQTHTHTHTRLYKWCIFLSVCIYKYRYLQIQIHAHVALLRSSEGTFAPRRLRASRAFEYMRKARVTSWRSAKVPNSTHTCNVCACMYRWMYICMDTKPCVHQLPNPTRYRHVHRYVRHLDRSLYLNVCVYVSVHAYTQHRFTYKAPKSPHTSSSMRSCGKTSTM